MLQRSQKIVSQQLDLAKFLQKQRMLILHLLTAVSPHQKFVIEKLSRLNLRESQEPRYDSVDEDPDVASP